MFVMGVKKKMYAKRCRTDFKTQLQTFLYDEGLKVVDQLERETKKLLNETLENRRSESGFNNAEPRIVKATNRKNKTGIASNLRIQMIDRATTAPHKTWHIVSAGVPNRVNKRSYTYPLTTKDARTKRRSLTAGVYSGYEPTEFRRAVKGEVKKGFHGRLFYSTTVQKLRELIVKKVINENNLFSISIDTNED
jgi:hypothetical protein